MGSRTSVESKPEKDEEESDDGSDEGLDDFFAQLDKDADDDAPRTSSKPKAAAPKKKMVPMMTPAAMAAAAKAAKAAKEPKESAFQENAFQRNQKAADKQRKDKEEASGRPDASASNAIPSLPSEDPRDAPLPRGEVGTIWEALEDSLVREGRDIKSARCGGSIEAGEKCSQTGPWRADPSGRVRMPIKGPRGLVGWVTIDERRVQNALDKTYGKLCLAVADLLRASEGGVAEETVQEGGDAKDNAAKRPRPRKAQVIGGHGHTAPRESLVEASDEEEAPAEVQPEANYAEDDDDPFLDFLVGSQEKVEQRQEEAEEKAAINDTIKVAAAACGMSVRAYRKSLGSSKPTITSHAREEAETARHSPAAAVVETEGNDDDCGNGEEETVAQLDPDTVDTATATPVDTATANQAPQRDLTETQKRLRSTMKKIRELETLKEKIGNGGTLEQRAKLEKLPELEQLAAQLHIDIAAEAKAASNRRKRAAAEKKGTPAEKKKKKKSNAVGASEDANEEKGERSSACPPMPIMIALAALAAGAYYAM